MKTITVSDEDFQQIGAILTTQAEQLDLELNALEESLHVIDLPHDEDDTAEDIATDQAMSVDAHAQHDTVAEHLADVRRLSKIFVGDL